MAGECYYNENIDGLMRILILLFTGYTDMYSTGNKGLFLFS